MERLYFLAFFAVMFDYTTFQSTDNAMRLITSEPIGKDMYQVEQGHWCQWCPAGKYLVKHCEDDGGFSICKTCPENQFIDYPNNKIYCISCTGCGQTGRDIVEPCTKTSDTECQCPLGKYWHIYQGYTSICLTHTVCPEATLTKGTPWKDTVCGEFTSTSISQSTPRPPTTSRDDLILSTGFSVPPSCPSINPVPCESHKLCCVIGFVIAGLEALIIIIAVFVICYPPARNYCRQSDTDNNSQSNYQEERAPALPEQQATTTT